MTDEKRPLVDDEDRYLLHIQQRAEMARLYPDGPEAKVLREWLQRFAGTEERGEFQERKADMTQDEKEKMERAMADAEWSDDVSTAQEREGRRQRERGLDAHTRLIASRAVDASRDALHDSAPLQKPGAYTVHESRDRAAHVPSLAREPEV
jgi:hypothetical protein